jgi:hypothetical protein
LLRKIVSGGQTGVDRGALDAALARSFSCGGWCPAGRRAEDGVIDARYPLTELEGGYRARTRQNVVDSDATLIIHFGPVTGGTKLTVTFANAIGRPLLQIDAGKLTLVDAIEDVIRFTVRHDVETLNVAGPRSSGEPNGQRYAHELIGKVIDAVTADHPEG